MPPFVIGLPADSEPSRISNIVHAAVMTDIAESDHKVRTISSGLGVIAIQAVGLSRLPFVLVPRLAIDVLQNTNSALEAGAITGLAFAAWCLTVGETINNGMSHYPAAVKAVGDNFPSSVKHFGNALAGLEASDKRVGSRRRLSLARGIGSPFLRHGRRGLTAVGIGIAPYIGTAGAQGQPKPAIRKLGAGLGIDGGLVIGAMSGIVTEAIVTIGHEHPEISQRIQEVTGNTKLWYGVAALLMTGEWLKNRIKTNKAVNQEEAPLSPIA